MSEVNTEIIGVGSPFGADRLGWTAIDELRARGIERDGVRLVTADRPGAGLIGLMEGRDAVIIIDALSSAGLPGAVQRVAIDTIALGDRFSNHGFGVADAIALGRVIGALPRRLNLIGIETGDGQSVPAVDWDRCTALVEEILRENDRVED
jgi:hydrogenase maturation protease